MRRELAEQDPAGGFEPFGDDGMLAGGVPVMTFECAVVAMPSTSMMSFSA